MVLKYASAEVNSIETLGTSIREQAQAKSVATSVWRDGTTFDRDLSAGPLGIAIDKRPAADVLAARRKVDQLLASTRAGQNLAELPGTRIEQSNLGKLFGSRTTLLADSDASEQKLEELREKGELSGARGRCRFTAFREGGRACPSLKRQRRLIVAQHVGAAAEAAAVVLRDAQTLAHGCLAAAARRAVEIAAFDAEVTAATAKTLGVDSSLRPRVWTLKPSWASGKGS